MPQPWRGDGNWLPEVTIQKSHSRAGQLRAKTYCREERHRDRLLLTQPIYRCLDHRIFFAGNGSAAAVQ